MSETRFGFVYIWRDRKRKKFYLGSHLGEKWDNYVGSGMIFSSAYKKRPEDFSRRILEEGKFVNRFELYQREQAWLDLISIKELGVKYYNTKKTACGGGDWADEVLENISLNNRNRIGSIHTPYGVFNSINDFVKKKGMISDNGLKNFLKGENRPISEVRARNNPLLSEKDIGKTPKELGWYFLEKKREVKDNVLKKELKPKIQTPYGIFNSVLEFSKEFVGVINKDRFRELLKECDKPISRSRVSKNKLFTNVDVGKTPRELGYYLIGE